MGSSLQFRLFTTYLVIIVVTLGLAALGLYLQVGGYRDSLSYKSLEDLGRLVELQASITASINAGGEPAQCAPGMVGSDSCGAQLLLDLRRFADEGPTTASNTSLAVVDANGMIVPGGWSSATEGLNLEDAVLHYVDEAPSSPDTRVPRRCRLEVPDGPALLCVTVPLNEGLMQSFPETGATHLVVAEPAASLDVLFEDLTPRLVFSGLFGVAAALVLGFLLSQSVAAPLRNIARAARNVARGSYRQRVPVTGPREVRELASTFNRMTGEVQRSQQTLRDFLANISHELKTPLTSIRGFSDAIRDGTIDDPEGIQRSARIIHDESNRVLRLVEELLDLSRMEAGQVSMEQEEFDLAELFAHVQEIFALRAEDSGITLEVMPRDSCTVKGDFDRLEQVMNNLLDNALRHTPAGGTVRVGSREIQPGTLQVTVADTGRGIPPEDVPHLFERFYRARDPGAENGKRRGYGLGLAITREIIRAHGGEIWATSEAGRGTMFVFTLPTAGQTVTRAVGR